MRTAYRTIPQRGTALAVLIGAALTLAAATVSAEHLYPTALMNWMVEDSFHAIIVDKSEQRLYVWHIREGEPRLVESYRCSTGEKEGDKWIRGDMRTPEGVYFFCSVIDGRKLPPKYGVWAFTTDYPNFVDRRRGKGGDGIWLHGRDKPLAPRPDSNGCIALENADLLKVSRFIRLQSTPLIVVKKMVMEPRRVIVEREREARGFVESWRQAWERQDLERYMSHYSPNFQSGWLDYASWKDKKRRLLDRYTKIRVKLGNVYIFRENGLITGIFTQSFKADGFSTMGIKILYMTHEGGHRIYSEDFHQQVDDPFPVRVLLAREGGRIDTDADSRPEFRIRLVSTDVPETMGSDEIERPRPVAPSRGVVLDTLALDGSKKGSVPALETNERLPVGSAAEALVQAQLLPEAGPGIEEAGLRRSLATLPEPPPPAPVAVAATVREGAPLMPQDVRAASEVRAVRHVAAIAPKDFANAASASSGSGLDIDETPQVKQFLNRWKSAWVKKDLDRYMKMYHPDFQAVDLNYDKLRKSKKAFFRKYQVIKVELDQVEITSIEGRLRVKFHQTFQGDDYRDKGWKTMVLVGGKGEGFRIIGEQWSKL